MCVFVYTLKFIHDLHIQLTEKEEEKQSWREKKVPIDSRVGDESFLVFIFYLRKSAKSFLEDETLVLSCILDFAQIISLFHR